MMWLNSLWKRWKTMDLRAFDPETHYGGLPVKADDPEVVLAEARRYIPAAYMDKVHVLETVDGRKMWYRTPDDYFPPGTRVIR